MSGSPRLFLGSGSRSTRQQFPFWLAGCSTVLAARQLLFESGSDGRKSTTAHCEASSVSRDNNNQSTTTAINKGDPDYPNFSRHGAKAVLPKYLTPQLYQQLNDLKTPKFGVTLEDMIAAGTMLPYGADPPRGIAGVYAGDADCYTTFAPLLLPLVEEYHDVKLEDTGDGRVVGGYYHPQNSSASFPLGVPRRSQQQQQQSNSKQNQPQPKKRTRLQRHTTNLDPAKILSTQLDPTGEYILYTRMRLARNLEAFPFSPKISRRDRRLIETCFKQIVQQDFQPLHGGAYLSIHDLTNEQHEEYESRRMSFLDPDEFKLAAGLGRDWPDGRGIYCCNTWDAGRRIPLHVDGKIDNKTEIESWEDNPPNVIMWCNYDDHFWIISVLKGGDVQKVFTSLSDAVRQLELSLLERHHSFSCHPKLGFLTSSPTNIGTALRASMSVKLVRLGKQHPKLFQEILHRLHLEAKSDYAETDDRYTGIFDIANAERLGRTEVQWINIMIRGIAKLIELEKKLERGETVSLQDVDDVISDVHKERFSTNDYIEK